MSHGDAADRTPRCTQSDRFYVPQEEESMWYRLLLMSAFMTSAAPAVFAQSTRPALPTSPRVAEIERKIEQARLQVEASQAALAALERDLADAQTAEANDLGKRARTGDETAIRAVLDQLLTDSK